MIFRFRYLVQGGHTHVRLFAGRSEASLGKCGDLAMRNEEWELFKNSFVEPADSTVEIQFKNEEDDHSTLIPR